jgi:SAM-dependent methyltransferase
MSATTIDTGARDAYDALAGGYDRFTAGYVYETWLARLEGVARRHGLCGRRLLDVACGTGSSFLPLLARGYAVTGCDISAAMLERARAKAPEAELHLADMRALPRLGSFDLVTCLDDALNYLLSEEDLAAALRGLARNLAPGGLAIWDLNTAAQYTGQFARDRIVCDDGLYIGWAPQADPAWRPGATTEVTISVFTERAPGDWSRSLSVHRQRHWTTAEVGRLAGSAGLTLRGVHGQRPGAVIDPALDERVHTKAIYVASAERGG